MAYLKAVSQLKSRKIKNFVKSYLQPKITDNYESAAIRVLIEKSSEEIWLKSRILEHTLNEDEHIVGKKMNFTCF